MTSPRPLRLFLNVTGFCTVLGGVCAVVVVGSTRYWGWIALVGSAYGFGVGLVIGAIAAAFAVALLPQQSATETEGEPNQPSLQTPTSGTPAAAFSAEATEARNAPVAQSLDPADL